MAALALSKHCFILDKVTTYIALVDVLNQTATVHRMEFEFSNDKGSVTLTKTVPAPIKDTISRLVHHLEML